MDALQWLNGYALTAAGVPAGLSGAVIGATIGAAAVPLTGLFVGSAVPAAVTFLQGEPAKVGETAPVSEIITKAQWTAAVLTSTSAVLVGGVTGGVGGYLWTAPDAEYEWLSYESWTLGEKTLTDRVSSAWTKSDLAGRMEKWLAGESVVSKWIGSSPVAQVEVAPGLLDPVYDWLGYETVKPVPVVTEDSGLLVWLGLAPAPAPVVKRDTGPLSSIYQWLGLEETPVEQAPVKTASTGVFGPLYEWFGA